MTRILTILTEGFADWEPAHALAELRREGKYRVETVALTAEPVESMGGIPYAAALMSMVYVLGLVVTPFAAPETRGRPLPD